MGKRETGERAGNRKQETVNMKREMGYQDTQSPRGCLRELRRRTNALRNPGEDMKRSKISTGTVVLTRSTPRGSAEKHLFLNKALVPGSFAARGRTFS